MAAGPATDFEGRRAHAAGTGRIPFWLARPCIQCQCQHRSRDAGCRHRKRGRLAAGGRQRLLRGQGQGAQSHPRLCRERPCPGAALWRHGMGQPHRACATA